MTSLPKSGLQSALERLVTPPELAKNSKDFYFWVKSRIKKKSKNQKNVQYF
jgi:hypothetical protein